ISLPGDVEAARPPYSGRSAAATGGSDATGSAIRAPILMRAEEARPPVALAARPANLFPVSETLEQIRAEIGEDCRRCKLAGGRKTIVFGSGNPKAEIVFVGEGPGADEDEQGLPFVGRAGQLL